MITDGPSFADELNRKIIDTIQRYMTDFDNGTISSAEMYAAMDALFSATAGLARDDITPFVIEMMQVAKRGYIDRVLFVNAKQEVVMVEHDMLDHTVKLKSQLTYMDGWQKEVKSDNRGSENPGKAAQKYRERLISGLLAKGYVEVK